ncbi:MAG: sigma-70 family RNA polymerase sigma factor [Anaerolineae bacterium]
MQDDRELIGRAKEYDPAAFAQIYERYYQGIYNYVYYRVGDPSLAEDLVADVFLKVMEGIESFTFRGVPFSAWLYRIANNLVIDYFRRQPRQPELALEEGQLAVEGGPVEALERSLTQEELARALRGLTEDQRQVIILKFVDGLSNTEVAQILGKTEGAIKSLQHRALASLSRILGEVGRDAAAF